MQGDPPDRDPDQDQLSQRAHRRIIGILGLLLPALLYIVAGLRRTAGLQPWKLLDSVSAYYYTGAVSLFVGILFALSLFLATYRGYKNVRTDRIVGFIGGVAGLIVAGFPTRAPCDCGPAWWSEWQGRLHYAAAVVLFLSFIVFALLLFPRSKDPPGRRPFEKKVRNAIFLFCGAIMALCVLWAGYAGWKDAPIFWPETIAIEAFALSWLVKGELHLALVAGGRRLMGRGR